MNQWRTACLALLLAFAALPLAAQQAGQVVRGTVRTEEGTAVPGALVLVRAAEDVVTSAIADGAGRFRLAELAPGSYGVEVQSVGYRPLMRTLVIEAGAVELLTLTLEAAPLALEGVVVSATRTAMPVAAIPAAITVVDRRAIEEGAAVSHGVGELLGKAVPGLAVGTQSMSNYGQTLRGRSVVVLIDGVPQSTLRNVSRDFATIDPAMVERVEVVRGATAIYGDGATGGVINIITRRPGVGSAVMRTELVGSGSLAEAGSGLGARLVQTLSGQRDALDYTLGATLSTTGNFYDAEGDLIPADPHGQGGLADTRAGDVFTKLGWTAGAQRLQVGVNYYHSDQDTRYTADPSVDALPKGEAKARALSGLEEYRPQGTRNLNASLDYTHAAVLGGELHVQAYHRDYDTRFRGFDRRVIRNGEWLSGHVGQSYIDSQKWGGRLELEWPLGFTAGTLLLGGDYTYENTMQGMTIMDPEVYDASSGLVFERTDDRVWVPALKPHNVAAFAQVGWEPVERVSLRGGVRHERIRMRVDDFVTIDDAAIVGGDVAYDPVLFNAGLTFDASESVNLFASFSQGFSLADIGRILRGAKAGFEVGSSTLEAPKVDHYELGLRGASGAFTGTVSGFYSTSDLGTRLQQDEIGVLRVLRAPERIYGAEASLEARHGSWTVGTTANWTEGEYRNEGTGEWAPFDSYRIQPMKLTGELAYETSGGWHNQLQVLYSGSRERLWKHVGSPEVAEIGYGQWPLESFTTVDFLSRRPLGRGTLELGVQNLLNARYFDVVSQLDQSDGNAYRTMARGAAFSLGYSITY